MSKTLRLIDCMAETACPITIDWNLCVICQKEISTQSLVCPAEATRQRTGDGYKTLADDLQAFHDIDSLPRNMNLALLDNGNGIVDTFTTSHARWHKSCRDNLNATKLARVVKRKHDFSMSDLSTLSSESTACLEFEPSPRKKRIASSCNVGSILPNEFTCFFCNCKAGSKPSEKLWQVRTFSVDAKVRECASQLQDANLLSKLAEGDMIATEARYHTICLINLYRRAARVGSVPISDHSGIVLAELVAYIEEVRSNQTIAPVLKLSELSKLYTSRLNQLGAVTTSRENATRLKERILYHFPDMIAVSEGRGHDVKLMFDENLGSTLTKAFQVDSDDDGIHLVRAAQIVRRKIFKEDTFSGSFSTDCQEKSIPDSLLKLVQLILEGPCISDTPDNHSVAATSISQLIVFNTVKKTRSVSDRSSVSEPKVRHSRGQETPLPIYMSLLLHSVTRKRNLIDKLFHLGLCISYDRVLQISADVANSVCAHYTSNGVVCPLSLRANSFTVGAIDNIDHNPSSATAQHSFHGTSISLMQNRFHGDSDEDGKSFLLCNSLGSKIIKSLPSSYTDVQPSTFSVKSASVPPIDNLDSLMFESMNLKIGEQESGWLKAVRLALHTEDALDNISWSAYHAIQQTTFNRPAITALLPLFLENAHTIAMIKHGMLAIKNAINHVNNDQTPVIALDQPLYALGKVIQWSNPDEFGEAHFVLLLGGLHIEMAAWKTIGDWLQGSGWTEALVQSKIAGAGVADSFLKSAHVKKTRHAHIVTVAALYVLRHNAFQYYIHCNQDSSDCQDFDTWCASKISISAQFSYWSKTLAFELTILDFVRSLREHNFDLYVSSLSKLAPWFFSLDHPHYARWVPVHIRDMVALKNTHPLLETEFQKGNFTVSKTSRAFSSIAVDHAHEQSNKLIKGEGGAVGLTGNDQALRRWMIAGPEISRMVQEFEHISEKENHRNHEQMSSYQAKFVKDVSCLMNTFDDLGNPFLAECPDLMSLQSKVLADDAAIQTISEIEKIGVEQYSDFVLTRLVQRTTPLDAPIHRNKLALFSTHQSKKVAQVKIQLNDAKNNCALFSRLYIASQSRDGNLDDFFMHENQAYPPALCSSGSMRHGTKSDLISCLEQCQTSIVIPQQQPPVDCVLLDGAVIVQMLRPATAVTFLEYGTKVFCSHVLSYLSQANRVDVVFDVYTADSLKLDTRIKRGNGVRRKVVADCNVPRNWQEFLRIDDNKTELFKFLAGVITEEACEITGKTVIVTVEGDVVGHTANAEPLMPCTHEEADTRLLLHAHHATQQGLKNILIRTVDTDVIVIAIASMHRLEVDTLWIGFGVGKHFRYIPVHEIANSLGPDKSRALTVFHALTGCDTVSSFSSRGKKSAFETWSVFPEVTSAFLDLIRNPSSISSQTMSQLERFVVLLYDRTSEHTSVNLCRKDLFSRHSRSMESIPPTLNALEQHVRRAMHQAVHIWDQALVRSPACYSPNDWGWEYKNGKWNPLWMTLPQASKACYELLRCGCKKGCSGNCKCFKACLKCTSLCNCSGECVNTADNN